MKEEAEPQGDNPISAVLANDLSSLKALIERNQNALDKSTREGNTALHYAAFTGSVPVIDLLVEVGGADTEKENRRGETPLHVGVVRGKGAAVERLLELGADGHTRDAQGLTPFHQACVYGHLVLAKLIHNMCNPSLSAKDNVGRSALHHATESGSLALLDYILSLDHPDVNAKDREGTTPLMVAAVTGSADCLKRLLEVEGVSATAQDELGACAMHHAAYGGNVDCLKQLMAAGAFTTCTDKCGRQPIHLAAAGGHCEAVSFFLDNGASVDVRDAAGDSPLHKAVLAGKMDCIELLIQAGASGDIIDMAECNVLHKAAYGGHEKAISFLLDNDVHTGLQATEWTGATPLHKAAFNGHHHAINALTGGGHAVDPVDKHGCTPLHCATLGGHLEAVQTLVQLGASVKVVDSQQAGLLHYAVLAGNGTDVLEELLKHKSQMDLDAVDAEGMCPLHVAIIAANKPAVSLLLDAGASVKVHTREDQSPADLAALQEETIPIAIMLSDSGATCDAITLSKISEAKRPVSANLSSSPNRSPMNALKTQLFKRGLQVFASKPKQGIQFFVAQKFIDADTPEAIGKFLFHEAQLSRASVGEVLGNQHNEAVVTAYLKEMDFSESTFLQAFRGYVARFQLPLESGPINRLVEAFAARYFEQHPYQEPGSAAALADKGDSVFKNTDAVYVLTYAVLQLNTDLYNAEVKNKMTLEQFMGQVRDVNGGEDFPAEFVKAIYTEIETNELKMETKDDMFGSAEKKGWLVKRGGRIPSMKNRWFILSTNDMMLYYFKKDGDSHPIGWIPLENLTISEDKKNIDNGFILSSTTGVIKSVRVKDGKTKQGNHRAFQMIAPDKKERDEWVMALKQNIMKNPFRDELWKRKQQMLEKQAK